MKNKVPYSFRYLLVGILCFNGWLTLYGQTLTDTMYFDNTWAQTTREKARYYRIIKMDVAGDFMFHVTDYYLSGQTQMTGTYRSIRPDEREGIFTWYYQDGRKQQECEYKNNTLSGPYTEWYPDGQIKTQQSFYNDLPDGPMKNWREDGTLHLDVQYSKGEKHGFFISYYPNGQMARKDLYDHDQFIEGQCFTIQGQSTTHFPYIVMPEYKGGLPELKRFIKKELTYPRKIEKEFREVTILVIFTVDEKGHIKNPVIINGDASDFNEEALRVIKLFPDWIPGKIDGIPASIQVTLPINFVPE